MDLDSISLLDRFIPIMGNTLGHIDDWPDRLNKGADGVNKIDSESTIHDDQCSSRFEPTKLWLNKIFVATR